MNDLNLQTLRFFQGGARPRFDLTWSGFWEYLSGSDDNQNGMVGIVDLGIFQAE